MPGGVYRLVLQDPNMKKLAPSSLDIGTHTTDTVKIGGSCMFYQVHFDTKILMDVTFVVVNNGNMLLSGKNNTDTWFDTMQNRIGLFTTWS